MGEELKHFIDTLTSFAFVLAFIFFLTALALGHDWLDALGPVL
jgi:preprotein translocase subunit SecG